MDECDNKPVHVCVRRGAGERRTTAPQALLQATGKHAVYSSHKLKTVGATITGNSHVVRKVRLTSER
jgi:hypothetical protein